MPPPSHGKKCFPSWLTRSNRSSKTTRRAAKFGENPSRCFRLYARLAALRPSLRSYKRSCALHDRIIPTPRESKQGVNRNEAALQRPATARRRLAAEGSAGHHSSSQNGQARLLLRRKLRVVIDRIAAQRTAAGTDSLRGKSRTILRASVVGGKAVCVSLRDVCVSRHRVVDSAYSDARTTGQG
jgi:hypothetical protein